MSVYNTLQKSGEMKEKLEKAKEVSTNVTGKIKDEIEKLQIKNVNFKDWHESICEEIRRIYKEEICCKDDDPEFTYGNAQKWVNMTLKYICILYEIFKKYSLKKEECEFCKKYKEIPVVTRGRNEMKIEIYLRETAEKLLENDFPEHAAVISFYDAVNPKTGGQWIIPQN